MGPHPGALTAMPYQWDIELTKAPANAGAFARAEGGNALAVLRLWPNRSLPRKGFVLFLSITLAMFAIPLGALLGTLALWGLLPFLVLAVFAIWTALERSYRDGRISEVLTLWSDEIEVVHQKSGYPPRDWTANPYWTRIEMHAKGGPVEDYLTLRGGTGRRIEVGAFLSADERKTLKAELEATLTRLPHPGQ